MKINTSEFIISAVKKSQYPEGGAPEVAFVGKIKSRKIFNNKCTNK